MDSSKSREVEQQLYYMYTEKRTCKRCCYHSMSTTHSHQTSYWRAARLDSENTFDVSTSVRTFVHVLPCCGCHCCVVVVIVVVCCFVCWHVYCCLNVTAVSVDHVVYHCFDKSVKL